MMWLYLIVGGVFAYILVTLYLTYLFHQFPRDPIKETVNWGVVTDTCIPTADDGSLEVWRVEPDGPSRGVVVFAHSWGRNRDPMVWRARVFGEMGFTTVMYSSRDHGGSSRHRLMNVYRFAEDMEAVLDWVDEPVFLYGHSAGAAAAVIAAHRTPDRVRLLFLEACYARTKEALLAFYCSYNRFLGLFSGPMVIFWLDMFYGFALDRISPVRLAPDIDIPVLIIHGELDPGFPLHHAWRLRDAFPPGRAELFVVEGGEHSTCSLRPQYPAGIKAFVDRHLRPLPDFS
ncbi:MAG: alpha/beta hydrolase [Deltaproteobacteria bacterium]|nr:alpha/beta hydrolase [Deltaproteobacteria bacterium]